MKIKIVQILTCKPYRSSGLQWQNTVLFQWWEVSSIICKFECIVDWSEALLVHNLFSVNQCKIRCNLKPTCSELKIIYDQLIKNNFWMAYLYEIIRIVSSIINQVRLVKEGIVRNWLKLTIWFKMRRRMSRYINCFRLEFEKSWNVVN